jgi:hypothetical protein
MAPESLETGNQPAAVLLMARESSEPSNTTNCAETTRHF